MRRALLLGLVALAFAGGCRRTVSRFGREAFYQGDGHYRIRYAADHRYELLPPPWQTQNFTHAARPSSLRDPRWSTVVELPGPSLHRPHRVRMMRVDALLRHGPTGSTAWAKTLLHEAHWPRGMDVPSIMRSVAQGIAVGRRLGPLVPEEVTPDPTAELTLVDVGSVIVDGRPGRYLTYDARRDAVWRATVVVMDAGSVVRYRGLAVPAIHVFGISTPRLEHDRGLRTLQALVSRVDFAPPP